MNRSLIAQAVCVAALTASAPLASPAQAKSVESVERVAIEGFRGPQAQRIQGAVETGLVGKYYVVPDFSVEEVARKKGVGLIMDDEFAEVGKALDVRAFVSADIQKRDGWHVRLLVRRGDTGATVGKILVADRRLDRLERQLSQRTSRRIEALLARAPGPAAPSAVEPPAVDGEVRAEAETEAEPSESKPAGRPGELLEVSLDGRVFSRSFSYAQNLSGLPEYKLSGAFASALELAFHPGVLLGKALAPVGITAQLEYGLGIGSRVTNSEQRRGSDVHGYAVGMQYRIPMGVHQVSGQLAYSARAFTTGETGPRTPDVRYSLLSAGGAGRAQLSEGVSVLGRAAYLHALSGGPLTDPGRFTRATIRGVELEGVLAYAVVPVVELRAVGGLRRLGWGMHAQPGDAWVAGGAVDQAVWGGVGLAYRPRP